MIYHLRPRPDCSGHSSFVACRCSSRTILRQVSLTTRVEGCGTGSETVTTGTITVTSVRFSQDPVHDYNSEHHNYALVFLHSDDDSLLVAFSTACSVT